MTEIAQITTCYLCGTNDRTRVDGVVRDMPELAVFECNQCQLVYLSSQAHVSDNFYEESNMHDSSKEVNMDAWLKETARDDERRFNALREVITNKKVLDFGSGNGGFLARSSTLSSKSVGVELEKSAVAYCRDKSLTVYSYLNEIKDDLFDVITMFHVLEHIQDPKSVLEKLRTMLAEGGRLIVEVPSSKDALLSLYKCVPFSKFTYWSPHLYLFSAEHLIKMGKEVGFKEVCCKQIQRYPLSNHLFWLAKGKPGGHQEWSFLDNDSLHREYEAQLAALGKCDTLFAVMQNS